MNDQPFDAEFFHAASAISKAALGETCMICERPACSAMHRLDGLPVCELCANTLREAACNRRNRLARALVEVSRPDKASS